MKNVPAYIFSEVEKFQFDEQTSMGRRDRRSGSQTATASKRDELITVDINWGEPYSGAVSASKLFCRTCTYKRTRCMLSCAWPLLAPAYLSILFSVMPVRLLNLAPSIDGGNVGSMYNLGAGAHARSRYKHCRSSGCTQLSQCHMLTAGSVLGKVQYWQAACAPGIHACTMVTLQAL